LSGVPEHVTSLPESGEGRNHDLWLLGRIGTESVTVCVEAKADEPFGNDTVSEYRLSAVRRGKQGTPTRVPERIDALLAIVGGTLSQWADVRYQLLTGICGTVLQAKADQSGCGVFVVHEFHTGQTIAENLVRNHGDYKVFLGVLGIPADAVSPGSLFGPVRMGGIDFFVGKAVRQA